MTASPATFRSAIIRAYTVRSNIMWQKYRAALTEVSALRRDLLNLPMGPSIEHGADPMAIADAMVGHGEAGSPFGMLLEAMELESLLDRIIGEIDEARRATVPEEGELIDAEFRAEHLDLKGRPVTEGQALNGSD